jgi:tyrosyl-tRNA synthetase
MDGGRAYGVISPLITQASGVKFGKTEAGNVWLDRAMTSPFRFYQYWINVDDADAVTYLKYFTLLPEGRIDELAAEARSAPHARAAQKALAEDVTRRLHGDTGLAAAARATSALFGGEVDGLTGDEIADIFADVPSTEIARDALSGGGKAVVDLLAETGIASSKGDARRSIEGGGVYVNGARVTDVSATVSVDQAIDGRFLLVRMGKKRYHLLAVVG